MTMTPYTLLAYRANRPRGPEECATDLSVFLNRLAKISPVVFQWKLRGSTKRKAMQNSFIDPDDLDFLCGLVLKGVNRRDGDRSIIPELGFSVSFWNGASKEEDAASLSIANGSTSKFSSNSVVLHFPYYGDLNKNLSVTVDLLSAAAEALGAERGLLFKSELRPVSLDHMFLETAAFLADGFDTEAFARLTAEADEIVPAGNGKIFLRR
ncbi:Imm52 family immunity protein [Rhizobium chutanense]|uniref:Immunity protein 52 domain-containing protein n=1 Tax=Rhizobium chutanense TaxID=2035448 RepID=A0A3S0QHF5_9HYPH|nr:Imm52 family immunity protein [Rhizobium chutanense]RUM06439.1 hypothetical protein EFR84_12490 [Rhizobium chutanense]